jgi:N-acyl-D-amino-acid deacylase
MHSHSDVLYLNGSPPLHKIHQGVTTELIGQDGISAAPVTETSKDLLRELIEPLAGSLEYQWEPWTVEEGFRRLAEKEPQLNIMTLVGHCNLRLAVMGHKMARPSVDELDRMGKLLAESLEQGAMGLSLGLIYPPSSYSETDELISLARVVREHDGIVVAHIRNEQEKQFEALEEMMTIGRESGCRIHISHLKCTGRGNWGKMPKVLEKLEHAVEEGIDISFDQYPYTASCTTLSILLPSWAVEGGWKGSQDRLNDPQTRESILASLKESIEGRGGASSVVIASVQSEVNQRLVGKDLEHISRDRGMSPEEAALQILIEEKLRVVAIYHAMWEEDVEYAMRHSLHTVGSDGILVEFPHPRTYGTFPRLISHFCRERSLLSLEEAIRRMTSAPAERLNLGNRGRIEPGVCADVILFDLGDFRDNASYENPRQFASGLHWVFVNGKPVLREGEVQDTRPGHVIRKKTFQA